MLLEEGGRAVQGRGLQGISQQDDRSDETMRTKQLAPSAKTVLARAGAEVARAESRDEATILKSM